MTPIRALDAGVVPAGEDAQSVLYESDGQDEALFLDMLEEVSGRYSIDDFDGAALRKDIEHDVGLLKKILKLVADITPDKDAKLKTLKGHLAKKPLHGAKCLIFTQYADTARYLFENLNPNRKRDDIEVIFSGDKSKERVANLRDGIRTARGDLDRGMFVFCQAGRFQQLFQLDEKGDIVSRDVPKVLGRVKCAPETKAAPLPAAYNQAVMAVQSRFAEEVRHREAERSHVFNLTHGQLYVMRELRLLFDLSTDEEVRRQVNILEKTYRGSLTGAVKKELNQLRRNGVTGESLLKALIQIYNQHALKDAGARRTLDGDESIVPRIICSEAFV